MVLASSPQEAVRAAEELGYPVVIKIASPDIPHKSDIGGVLLNLTNADAVRTGFEKAVQNAKKHAPNARILGVHVQKMIPSGQEVIIGAVQDPQFGNLVMFGSGGVEVEGLKDIAFSLAPLTDKEVDYLLKSTWAGQKLDGFRNIPSADKEAVKKALICLSQLVSDFPEIEEIDLNPLRVLPPGQGVVAIDIRIKLKPDS
jgi:acetyltransferase